MVLAYLGYSVDSADPGELEEAERVLKSVRPYVRYFSSTKMLIDLPNSEICVAMSWSGDYATARTRAREAGVDINLAYSVPSEGSIGWYDGMFIPADAPHPDTAHAFIDFILRPDVIAAITNFIDYANALPASNPMIKPEILSNPAAYPTPEILATLQPKMMLPPKIERQRTRIMAREDGTLRCRRTRAVRAGAGAPAAAPRRRVRRPSCAFRAPAFRRLRRGRPSI
jgi:putrescine transport system substrate-binding protein